MKFAIIGFGRIARKFAKSIEYTTEGQIYAIGSKSIKEDDEYLIHHPEVKVYHDYEVLLDDPNVEAVYIALPHKFHKEWVIKALRHHIPVICEKPAVLSVKDMEEIKTIALEEQTYFLEALKTKLNDGMDHLKEDIKLLGKISHVEANFCSDATMGRGSNSFLFDKEQGGALNDVGPYLIGFVLDLISQPIKEVKGKIKLYDDIEEHFNAKIIFEDGVIADIEGAIDEAKERYALITGEKGRIIVPMFNRIIDYAIKLNNGETIERHYSLKGDDMTKEIQCLIDDVNHGLIENKRHSLDDSIAVVKVMNNIRKQ